MLRIDRKIYALSAIAIVMCYSGYCYLARQQGPAIAVVPVELRAGQWQVAIADTITIIVNAPGATVVRILARPVISTSIPFELKSLNSPSDSIGQIFATEWRPPPNFAGSLWAELVYPDGTKRRTESLMLAAKTNGPAQGQPALDSMGGSLDSDESAHSDKFTGGKIRAASLVAGDPRIWITVNVPAFQLTLWQNGKAIKTWQVAVGRKNFPVIIGGRKASEIVWNPEWIPPNSSWVEKKGDVEVGELIKANDPRNPLGKIKIPLEHGYLIHEAAKPSDIGRLVSHGCIRMLTGDLFELSEKIVAARGLPVKKEQIARAKAGTSRLSVTLDPPLWVDINYDTQVIEGGMLHLYPDVYGREKQALEALRVKLQASGISANRLDELLLKQMLERANLKDEFVVSVAEINAGNALITGRNLPVVKQPNGKPVLRLARQPVELTRK